MLLKVALPSAAFATLVFTHYQVCVANACYCATCVP